MTVYTLKPGAAGLDTDGPAQSQNDAAAYTLGLSLRIGTLPAGESNPRITEIHFWRSAQRSDGVSVAPDPPTKCGVFDADTKVLVAGTSAETFTDPGATTSWITHALAAPVPIDSAHVYRAAVYWPSTGGEHYTATPFYWDSGVGAAGLGLGPVHLDSDAQAAPGDGGQCSFGTGATDTAYPGGSFHAANYGIGITIETDDAGGPSHGSITDTITWTTGATGSTEHHGAAADSITWTTHASGHAPELEVPHGDVTDTVQWTVEVASHAEHHGHAAEVVHWTTAAAGHADHGGAIADSIHWRVTVHGTSLPNSGPSRYPTGVPITLVTRTKTGQRDGYGKDIYAETLTLVIGVFDPAVGSERTDGMDQVSQQPQVLLPPLPAGVTITSVDQVEIDGLRYDVDGVANTWNSPWTGRRFGVAVPLKRVTG